MDDHNLQTAICPDSFFFCFKRVQKRGRFYARNCIHDDNGVSFSNVTHAVFSVEFLRIFIGGVLTCTLAIPNLPQSRKATIKPTHLGLRSVIHVKPL